MKIKIQMIYEAKMSVFSHNGLFQGIDIKTRGSAKRQILF